MKKNSYKKAERLKSRKAIDNLFRHGKSYTMYPFRMLYREVETITYPVMMTVAVPKRLVRNATSRNLIKRRTREAYRLRKTQIYRDLSAENRKYEVLFLYQAEGVETFQKIVSSVNVLLHRLKNP